MHAGCGPPRLDRQHARLYRAHRVCGIHDQSDDALLQLHGVAHDRGKLLVELRLDPHAILLQIEMQQRQHGETRR